MRTLYRSTANRRLTGLCGGLAEYMGISPTLVRFLTIISAFCSFGTTLLVYVVASLFIPKRPYMPYM